MYTDPPRFSHPSATSFGDASVFMMQNVVPREQACTLLEGMVVYRRVMPSRTLNKDFKKEKEKWLGDRLFTQSRLLYPVEPHDRTFAGGIGYATIGWQEQSQPQQHTSTGMNVADHHSSAKRLLESYGKMMQTIRNP